MSAVDGGAVLGRPWCFGKVFNGWRFWLFSTKPSNHIKPAFKWNAESGDCVDSHCFVGSKKGLVLKVLRWSKSEQFAVEISTLRAPADAPFPSWWLVWWSSWTYLQQWGCFACVCVCLAMPKTDTVPPYRKGKLPFPIRLQPDKDATNPWTCFAKPLKELRLRGFWYIVTGEIGETAQFLNKYDFEHSNSAFGEPLFQSFPVFCRPIPF